MSFNCILLKRTGGVYEIETDSFESDILTLKLKKHGSGKPQILVIWEIDEYEYKLFGYKYGDAGQENKHDLPPPIDNELYFGDLLVYKTRKSTSKLCNLIKSDYLETYEFLFGGFEDLGTSDTEYNDENGYCSEDDPDYHPEEDINIEVNYKKDDEDDDDDSFINDEIEYEKELENTDEEEFEFSDEETESDSEEIQYASSESPENKKNKDKK